MKKYGIIGRPLGHSFSKKYFEDKFAEEALSDCVFENHELETIDQVKTLISDPDLKGFCITIPYKRAIIPYLTEMSDAVRAMDACNCVQIKKGKLIGYNTDVIGFEQSFVPQLNKNDHYALILGTGGAASAVCYVLEKLGLAYKFVSRSPSNEQFSYEEIKSPELLKQYTVIINCSPVGTYPKEEQAPDIAYDLLTEQHYLYDLVYNPPLTRFLQNGQANGARIQNGYPMLAIQAEANWVNWNKE
ncbi:shikimate dehydrogenase [Arachidicoccus rhizosphaerae]|jgi:shikimate dehydrogenase|uniref:Shikimate dehydrogenase n=1 Tax=Arachidicoccus rhizosphaerae TaxID=551991 RepID=A0A1H3YX24_9BACT|nr:shikimate dehydrogenase [Arachidicoccus rhizosphaerae]SEA15594.1 shikimate dehydrogenase [Arachidicoccus rhizosphaerae]